MKTSEILNTLNQENKELEFLLPDGESITGDLHITEIKNVNVDSTDCGGNTHSFEETIIQLWLNEESNRVADWTIEKARKIFDIVGAQRPYLMDAEAYIEFGDSSHLTSKYGFVAKKVGEKLVLQLEEEKTVCKPRLLHEIACC